MTATVTGEALRTCRDCVRRAFTEEELDSFVKNPRYKYGRKNLCKPCHNVRTRGWEAANTDRRREYKRQWREANRDHIAEYRQRYDRAYYEANRDRIAQYKREYYEANRDRISEQHRAYREANRDRLLEHQRGYHSTNRTTAIDIYGGKCVHCGSVDDLEFDHVNNDGKAHREIEPTPSMLRRIANTGQRLDDWELQLLCQPCHLKKTAEHRDSHKPA